MRTLARSQRGIGRHALQAGRDADAGQVDAVTDLGQRHHLHLLATGLHCGTDAPGRVVGRRLQCLAVHQQAHLRWQRAPGLGHGIHGTPIEAVAEARIRRQPQHVGRCALVGTLVVGHDRPPADADPHEAVLAGFAIDGQQLAGVALCIGDRTCGDRVAIDRPQARGAPGVAAHIAPVQLQLRIVGSNAGRHRQVDLALALLPAEHQRLAETEFAQGHLPADRAVAAPFGELAGDAVGGMGTANHARQDERGGGCKQRRAASLGHGVTSRGWGWAAPPLRRPGENSGRGLPRRAATMRALARPSP